MSAGWELQKALRTRLRADAGVAALLAADPVEGGPAVLDHVPQDADAADAAPFPYLVIGDDTAGEWDTDDTVGRSVVVPLHVWSRYAGRKEVKQILDACKAALHDQALAVSGEHVVLALVESMQSFLDADGITRHGVLQLRVLMVGS